MACVVQEVGIPSPALDHMLLLLCFVFMESCLVTRSFQAMLCAHGPHCIASFVYVYVALYEAVRYV